MLRCKPTGTGFAFAPSGLTRFCCALIFFFLIPAYSSRAAIWRWTGNGGNSNWSTGGNWDAGTGPTSASTTELFFEGTNNTGTALIPLNQNIASPFQLNNLTFGGGSGSFFLGGGELAFTGASNTITQASSNAQTIANNISASQNSTVTLTLTGSAPGMVTFSGAIQSGNGNRDYAINKTGASTVYLAGTNTYEGGTTISGGTLVVNSAASLGDNSGGLTLNAGTLEVAVGFSSSRAITLNSAASTFQIDPSQTYTVTSAITGTGALNKTGTGTMVLGGANTYSGGTVISAGTLQLNAADRLLNTGALTISGGTFDLQTFTETVGVVTLSSGSIIGTGTLTGSAYAFESGIVSARLGGTGALTKTTSGTLALSGANSFSGGSTINGGTVIITSSTNLGAVAGGLTINAGTLEVAAGFTTARLFTLGNAASTFQIDAGQTFTVNTGIIGTGALNKTGAGTMVLNAVNPFSGGTNVAGGILRIDGNDRLLTSGAITITGGTFDLQTFTQTAGAVTLSSGSITGSGAGALSASSFTLQSGTATAILAGGGSVTKNTAGTVTLSGSNTFTGSTTISAGTLQVNTNNALGTVANGTTVANGAVLTLNNVNYSTAESLTINGSGISNGGALTNIGTSTFAGSITAATDATINAGGGTLTLTGGLVKNGTTLTIAGGGTVNITNNGITGSAPNSDLVVDGTTVVLNAANSYNGPTTIQNSGTLRLGNNNVLPNSPQTALTVNTSSIFDLASYNDGVASLTGDSSAIVKNSVAGGTSTFTVSPGSGVTTTFAGGIAGTNGGTQGNIALQKDGAGTLILSGGNTYSGTTTVSGGTLTAASSSGSALGSTSSVTVNAGGTLLLGTSNQINNAATMTLNGGTFALGAESEGAAGTNGVGALTLAATSTIDFAVGATSSIIQFAGLGGHTAGMILQVTNWNGTPGTGGGSERLLFTGTTTDFTSFYGQSDVTFNGVAGYDAVQFGGYYEVTAVPEAGTWIAGALAFGALALSQGWRLVKRRRITARPIGIARLPN